MTVPKPKPAPASVGSTQDRDPVAVKLVKAYPIPCAVFRAEGQPLIPCEILKLTEIGFLIRIGSEHLLRVSDKLHCQFHLPVEDTLVQSHVKVIKTYLGLGSSAKAHASPGHISGEKVSTVELHFVGLPVRLNEEIQKFIRTIGQK